MVTRKPVPQQGNSSLAPTTSPPYPVTPISTDTPKPFSMQDARGELRSATDSDAGSANVWSGEGLDAFDKPDPAAETMNHPRGLPESLRVGPPSLSNSQKSSQEALRPNATSTNPFLKRQATGSTTGSKESSANAWGESPERPAQPSSAPPPPPVPQGKPDLQYDKGP